MEPNGHEVRARIEAELVARGWEIPEDQLEETPDLRDLLLDGMTTLVVGILRRSIPPAGNLAAVWQDQVIAWLGTGVTEVVWPDQGMHRPAHIKMLAKLFKDAGLAPVPPPVLGQLADIAAYATYRQMTPSHGFLVVGLDAIGQAFLAGCTPPWW